MDTKTLVVGQKVRMRSGKYVEEGKVVAAVSSPPGTIENGFLVPEWYVEVEVEINWVGTLLYGLTATAKREVRGTVSVLGSPISADSRTHAFLALSSVLGD